MNIPVFDFHCDTSRHLWDNRFTKHGSLYENQCHIDLKRAETLAGYAQCFACFTTTGESSGVGAKEIFEKEYQLMCEEVERYSDIIAFAASAQDVVDNQKKGKMSAIMTIEGPAGFDFQPERLEPLYKIGFRISTLGWNEDNPLTGSCVTGGGLKDRGVEYLKEAQRLGIVIDVSHISDAGFWDIIEITEKPIIASHSNSRTLCNVPRNLTDEMYLAICQSGGSVGINLYNKFLGENPNLDTVCDHIFHFLNLAGTDRHISLGGDLDGCSQIPAGFAGVQSYPLLADRLFARGLSEESIRNIFWNNALGVMERCSM